MEFAFADPLIIPFSVITVLFLLLRTYVVLTAGKCKLKTRLDGKIVIVTGSNSGIGKETSRELLRRGAKVIMACRSTRKADDAANEFKNENPNAKVSVKQLDLCDFASIRKFVHEIMKEEKRIDILINNAGTSGDIYKLTKDGFEEIYQANLLGAILLTDLLLPLLKKSAPSRIVNVGSIAYLFGKISTASFEAELKKRFRSSRQRYMDSKLAMLMWTRAMGAELHCSGVTVNVVHPGLVRTPFAGSMVTFDNIFFRLMLFVLGRSTKDGAETVLHLCLDPAGDEENGHYWAECGKRTTWKGNNQVENSTILEIARKALRDKKGQ